MDRPFKINLGASWFSLPLNTINQALHATIHRIQKMLIIQIGQCGIQLGSSLSSFLASHIPPNNAAGGTHIPYPFTAYPQILVDTEHKTWSSSVNSNDGFKKIVVDCGRIGRGNVWAYGYRTNVSQLEETVRKIVEKDAFCDGYEVYTILSMDRILTDSRFLLIHSIAGGTGSGLGSRVLTILRDSFPTKPIMTLSVVPFLAGETPLQFYNAVLSLNALHCTADVIAWASNDDALWALKANSNSASSHSLSLKKQQASTASGKINVDMINDYIAHSVGNTLLPMIDPYFSTSSTSSVYRYKRLKLYDIITSVAPMPSMKMTSFFSSYTSVLKTTKSFMEKTEWDYLANTLLSHIPKHTTLAKPKLLSSQLYVRGVPQPSNKISPFEDYYPAVDKLLEKLPSSTLYNPFPMDVIPSLALHPSHNKSMSLMANSNLVLPHLEAILDRSERMWEKGAYIGWYRRYWKIGGPVAVEIEDIMAESLERCRSIVESYRDL